MMTICRDLFPSLDFKVGNVIMPDVPIEEGLLTVSQTVGERKIPLEKCQKGDVITLDDKTYLEVLHPKRDSYIKESPQNNNSLVLMLYYGKVRVLFTGDAEKEGEALMLEDGIDLQADVLKVGHHGSPTSTTEAFLDAVKPAAAMVSVGRNNFGHPSAEVLELIESKGIKVLRTDMYGAIVLETFGDSIRIKKTVSY